MKIGISCSGEGRGHASRVIAITKQLHNRHEVVIWCPHKVRGYLRKHLKGIRFHVVPHSQLIKKDHQIDLLQTILVNQKNIFNSLNIRKRLIKQLNKEKVDIIISDYEPFLALAAKKLEIPVLALNHQLVISKVGAFDPEALLTRMSNALMIPYANEFISSSFYEGDVGPIIREEITKLHPAKNDYFLVYMKPEMKRQLEPILKKHKNVRFEIFPDRSKDYLRSLENCKGIIAAAGHQMISEALYLKKPIFAIPEIGQYEQRLNAEMLDISGQGMTSDIDGLQKNLKFFISNVDKFPLDVKESKITFNFDDDTAKAVLLIESFIYRYSKDKVSRTPNKKARSVS